MQKAKIKFENDIYWLDLGTGKSDFDFEILDKGQWRHVKVGEADLFSVMETGEVIGDNK
jgi:hypothetical protein